LPNEKKLLKSALGLAVAVGLILATLVATGILRRSAAEKSLAERAAANVTSHVAAVHPKPVAQAEELVLPASVQAYTEAPIYARTSGYLKKWYFDIGAKVKRGALLAEIETPEGDQQLEQARADLKVAEANAALAKTTSDRWETLYAKNAVSRQETDQAVSEYAARQAAVAAAQANVRRLEQLQNYEMVYAPFDGVITARETDIGALISPNSTKELFHLVSVDKLRVYAAVPEISASSVKPGAPAELTSDQFPNRVFKGQVIRDSGSFDAATRTLNVEVDIENPTGELLPGAYGFLHFHLPAHTGSITIPANALIFRAQGTQAAVIRDGRAAIVPIKIGRDFGDKVEILSGLTAADEVILDPSDALTDGTPVDAQTSK
jgi:RND family efflux transporter MFP subunit